MSPKPLTTPALSVTNRKEVGAYKKIVFQSDLSIVRSLACANLASEWPSGLAGS